MNNLSFDTACDILDATLAYRREVIEPATKGLPSVWRDAIIVRTMMGGNLDGERWLDHLYLVSEENREAALRKLVELRLYHDSCLPFWLHFACRAAQQHGWSIPDEWIAMLRAALSLWSNSGFQADAPRRLWDGRWLKLRDSAQSWLDRYDENLKPGGQ